MSVSLAVIVDSQPEVDGGSIAFSEASIDEDLLYVDLERHVHQSWRFAKGRDLRVHMYAWINERLITEAPTLRLL